MRTSFIATKLLICSLLLILVGCGEATPPKTTPSPLPAAGEGKNKALFNSDIKDARVLVFTKTKGWRHDSIPAGIAALQKMATDNFFTLVATEDAELFTDAQLSGFNAIVFLNTTLDVLDDNQQIAMERFIQAGGGFVGIHSAADTEWEGDWFWYRKLVGAVFKSHPNEPSNVQMAQVTVKNKLHLATEQLPEAFELADEWYNYRDFYEFNKVLMTVDETTYHGGEHGSYHPITWYHDFDGGRSFYTGLGHTIEAYSNPKFLSLLLGGLKYAVGGKPKLDYSKSRPEDNRFIKKPLVQNLTEPVNFTFFKNGDALIAERAGSVKLVEHGTNAVRDLGKLDVAFVNFLEMGLLGLAVDPAFERTHFIYAAINIEKQGGDLYEALARYKLQDGKLDDNSREILFEYPVNRNCCHTGGDLEFDDEGNLFMSTGDNSNPHDQHGYAPIDMRQDEVRNDALRSAGNTQDLRGKVLRIRPLEKGGYDIPAGNLFKDPKDGRPEIYVMGARNPYKIAYDKAAKELFFGDVGPDAGEDSDLQGPRGYDEINRAKQAGNFGWPLFVGNNYAYKDYDFATQKSQKMYNPMAPVNDSPRNTGLKQLPPAQRALIWYPYGLSDQFPELGKGGRCAIVADVYHGAEHQVGQYRYPDYYNNKLFIVDFMRNWVKAVSYDDVGRIIKIEPFAKNIDYSAPIDARFSPDGSLYVLEYGKAWFKGNPEAGLSRIEFVGSGNRPPIAAIKLNKTQGAVPFSATASAAGSVDLDGDKLSFSWSLKAKAGDAAAKKLGDGEEVDIKIAEAGDYVLTLTATDNQGAAASADAELHLGNEPAQVDIHFAGNQTFYWPGTKSLAYKVVVNDQEDGVVANDADNLLIGFGLKKSTNGTAAEGHQQADNATIAQDLMRANGCKSCHSFDVKVVGPAFKDVAAKYKNDKNAVTYLVNKIGKGGNGVWGELNMPSFATLSEAERTALATYVLSLANKPKSLPLQGELNLTPNAELQKAFESNDEPQVFGDQVYELQVAYTDKGSASAPAIKVQQAAELIPARFLLANIFNSVSASKLVEKDKLNNHVTIKVPATGNWLTFGLGAYDLTSINSIRLGSFVSKANTVWQFELRLGSDTGTVLASADSVAKVLDAYNRTSLKLSAQTGVQEVYLAVRSNEKSAGELHLYDISFHK